MSDVKTDTPAVTDSVGYFEQGLYCSEAILRAFNQHYALGLDESALKMATVFGAGMGGSKCACGAVVGGALVLSAALGRTSPEVSEDPAFAAGSALHDGFKKAEGSICCRVLTRKVEWGSPEHAAYCVGKVRTAAALAEDLLKRAVADTPQAAENEGEDR